MDQSSQLRERQSRDGGGKSINTNEAKSHDVKVRDVMKKILKHCQLTYPDKSWSLLTNYQQITIASSINPNYKPQNIKSSIRPDGGILCMNNIPVLVTEAKKQGTNTLREKEGKPKQAQGNAIERAHKNYNELKNIFDNYPFFPYLIFAYGCDFCTGSSIIDRCAAMTYYDSYNTLHVKDTIIQKKIHGNIQITERHKKTSIFIQEEPFSEDFIFEKSMETIQLVMDLL